MDAKTPGYNEAIKAVIANKSPRFRRLEALESWVKGTQYLGRPDWFSSDVPLWERAPCVKYPIVRLAASSNVDLMLGERAFPRFAFKDIEKPGDKNDKSPDLDRVFQDLHRVSRWRTTCRDAYTAAQGCGTACAVYGVRKAKLFGDLVPAKWCEPTFSDSEFTVKRLEIRYPYLDEVRKSDGTYEVVAKLYRRVIDDQTDTVYHPALASEGGDTKINWKVDKDKTVDHGFGFCPVVWYPFMRGAAAVNVIDGFAIHEGLRDEIQAHDIARSQWHKTALYTDPQPYEVGVDPDHNPTGDTGREALVPTTANGGQMHPEGNPVTGAFVDKTAKGPARKKGPGHVWRYPGPETKVGYLTTPGDALVSQKDNVADLRIKLQESLAVVFLDPENIKFAATTSGKALEAIKQKQFDRVDQHREDFRDGFLLPSLAMQIRIAKQIPIKVPGVEILKKIDVDTIEFSCAVQWGSYTAPDFAEQKQIVELIQAALGGKVSIVDLKTAIQKLQDADLFEIEDPDALIEQIQKESDERQARAMETAAAQSQAKHTLPSKDEKQ